MILIDFDFVRSGLANMRASEWNRISKAVYMAAGHHWHDRYLADHFTPKGAKKYGYTPRAGEDLPFMSKRWKRSYAGRKWLSKHHRNPLVFSGDSLSAAKVKDVRGTRNRASVLLHAPALNFRNPKSHINMRTEVLTVTGDEVRSMTAAAQAELNHQIKAWNKTKRTKIKAK